MQLELQQEVSIQMISMLENWQVPTERILSWFSKAKNNPQGMWFTELTRQEILFAYYEMIYLGEGFHSSEIKNLSAAHPMRVVILYKYLQRIDKTTATICGEKFFEKEIEIILLTTGKLSVEEISNKVNLKISEVIKVLNKLENKHLIVYVLH